MTLVVVIVGVGDGGTAAGCSAILLGLAIPLLLEGRREPPQHYDNCVRMESGETQRRRKHNEQGGGWGGNVEIEK